VKKWPHTSIQQRKKGLQKEDARQGGRLFGQYPKHTEREGGFILGGTLRLKEAGEEPS